MDTITPFVFARLFLKGKCLWKCMVISPPDNEIRLQSVPPTPSPVARVCFPQFQLPGGSRGRTAGDHPSDECPELDSQPYVTHLTSSHREDVLSPHVITRSKESHVQWDVLRETERPRSPSFQYSKLLQLSSFPGTLYGGSALFADSDIHGGSWKGSPLPRQGEDDCSVKK